MDGQNRSDHATNVTAADGNVTAVSDIVERLHDILDGPVPMYVSRQDLRDVISEIKRLTAEQSNWQRTVSHLVALAAERGAEIERLKAAAPSQTPLANQQ